MADTTRVIRVHALARVEGEGGLRLRMRGDTVTEAALDIYEPPRFFEGFLVGRGYEEVPDVTARICGICPVAYQISSVRAMERLLGITVDPNVERLRAMLYYGEWIESHALHVFLLHAPDFLGYEDALTMAKRYPDQVEGGLRLKKFGNTVMRVIGGREVHPINIRVGGVHRAPEPEELAPLADALPEALGIAETAVRWVSRFSFPPYDGDYQYMAVDSADYPLVGDGVATNRGLKVGVDGFEEVVEERQVPHSTALHAEIRGEGPYLTGPLARYNLGRARLAPRARALADEIGLPHPLGNPFQSIVVRCLEMVHALESLKVLLAAYRRPDAPFAAVPLKAGRGAGVSEAPRGVLYHRYEIDGSGRILSARIVPPTAQNQAQIERDVVRFAPQLVELPQDEMSWRLEQLVRSYDPCISCSAHFLKVSWDRET
jgi:sulfhydrogenase subunit alpha